MKNTYRDLRDHNSRVRDAFGAMLEEHGRASARERLKALGRGMRKEFEDRVRVQKGDGEFDLASDLAAHRASRRGTSIESEKAVMRAAGVRFGGTR